MKNRQYPENRHLSVEKQPTNTHAPKPLFLTLTEVAQLTEDNSPSTTLTELHRIIPRAARDLFFNFLRKQLQPFIKN